MRVAELVCRYALQPWEQLEAERAPGIRAATPSAADEARPRPSRVSKDQKPAMPLPKRRRAAASKEPPGASLDPRSALPPNVDLDAEYAPVGPSYAHFRWRIERARREGNAADMLALAARATRAYQELMGGAVRDSTLAAEERRLLTHLQGCSADEAADWMRRPGDSHRDSLGWVRKTRSRHGRRPGDGRLDRHPDARLALARELEAEGHTQGQIARELKCSQSLVSKLLSGAA